jgi:hypothetical protein
MKTKSKLERLPPAVKTELIDKLLTTSGKYDDIAKWLYVTHNQKHSKSAIWRFARAIRLMHEGLIDLDMPPATLSANAGKLEKLGAYLVQRELLNRRIDALQKAIFDESPVTKN